MAFERGPNVELVEERCAITAWVVHPVLLMHRDVFMSLAMSELLRPSAAATCLTHTLATRRLHLARFPKMAT